MTMLSDDETERLLTQWPALQDRVEEAARAALADPARAERAGLVPAPQSVHGGQVITEPPLASWLRAAARALIPAEYDWEIVCPIGGEVFLLLRGFVAPGMNGFGGHLSGHG